MHFSIENIVKGLLLQMDRKILNCGLRPTGRIMMLLILAIFLVLFVITSISFAMIAHTGTARNQDLLARALETQLVVEELPSRRGPIRDRNGINIATQHPSHRMHANFNPDWGSVVEDIDETARKLSDVIDMERDDILQILSQDYNEDGIRIWHIEFGDAGRRLSFNEKSTIEELDLSGIYFRDDLTRFYPQGEFASHTVGYTMFYQPDTGEHEELRGGMGIESFFNDKLTGRNGAVQFQRDFFGFRQPGHEPTYITEPLDGYEIRLTIDSTIQVILESAMSEVAELVEPDKIVAIVMDARTGEILAAGERPTFNPNDRDPGSYQNAIMYQFEPGSTLKIYTYAAAINEGNYQGDLTFHSGGRTLPGGILIGDHGLIPRMEMTFDEGFFVSANTATVDLLRHSITPEKYLDYLRSFGFGEATGLTLHGENAGIFPNIYYNEVDAFSSAFGQGIAVTPIQQVQAMTAFLNDGEMIRPQLIAEIYDPNTNRVIYQFERQVIRNPITAETAAQMRELMVGVVESDMGTGRVNYVLDVPSGGKTGTAEIPDRERGGYLDGVHIYSYIGFAPADDPEIIMFVAIENPTIDDPYILSGHPFAGQIYRTVMSNTLNYLGITQEQVSEEGIDLPQFERIEVPGVVNLSTDVALSMVEELDLTPIVIGNNASVFRQHPTSGLIIVGDKVFIQTDMEDQIPDFTGWTRLQITRYAMLLDLDLEIIGSGVGASQTIRAGNVVRQWDSLTVTLE